MAIKLAVFDMAGTTVADEDAVANAFHQAFSNYGYVVDRELVTPLMGYKKEEAIRLVLDKIGVTQESDKVDGIHDEFIMEMLDYYEYSPEVSALPGAEDVFTLLKERGIKIALNTGFPRAIADAILSRLQWKEKGLVDEIIASDEVAKGRPDPSMIQILMKRSGITDAKEVIKIGDTEVDINEGRNAGCALVIGITTGAFSKAELEPYHPDFIIAELSELPPLIFSLD